MAPPQFKLTTSDLISEEEDMEMEVASPEDATFADGVEGEDDKPNSRVLPFGDGEGNDNPSLPNGGGEELDATQKAAYEESLGIDLGDVRIHQGGDAQESVEALGAEAFAHETDIYLKEELKENDPRSEKILAHELMHVKQYKEGKVPSADGKAVSSPNDTLEVEAYGQENELAKTSMELRGIEADSPILSQSYTPPTTNEENQLEEKMNDSAEGQFVEENSLVEIAENEEEAVDGNASLGGDLPIVGELEANEEPAALTAEKATISSPLGVNTAVEAEIIGRELPELIPTAIDQIPALQNVERPSLEGPAVEFNASSAPLQHDSNGQFSLPSEAANVYENALAKADELRQLGSGRLAAFRQSSATTKERIRRSAASTKESIRATFSVEADALQAKVSAQTALIETSAAGQKMALEAFGSAELARFDAGKGLELANAAASLASKKAALAQLAIDSTHRARTESDQDAQTIIAESEAFEMGSESEANDAKRKALTDIAQEAAQKIRKNGADVAGKIQSEAGEFAKTFDKAHQDFVVGIETESSKNIQVAVEYLGKTQAQIDRATTEAKQALSQTLQQGKQSLSTESQSASTIVDRQRDQMVAQVAAAEQEVAAEFTLQFEAAADSLVQYGKDAQEDLLQADPNDTEGIQAAVDYLHGNIQAYLAEMVSGFATFESQTFAELDSTAIAGEAIFADTTTKEAERASSLGNALGAEVDGASKLALDGITQLVLETQGNVRVAVDEVLGGIAEARTQFETELESNYQKGAAQFVQFVTDGLQAGKNLLGTARGKMGEAVAAIDNKYTQLKSEAESQNGRISKRILRGFWSWLGGVAESVGTWFKDTFGEWLGGLLFGLLEAIVIVAVGMVAAFVLGAILVACGLTAFVAGIVVLVIAVVVGIAFGIYNRFQEYAADHNGEGPGFWWSLGCIGLGILDLTGIPFIIEGAVGYRATGGELSDFERGERIAMGVVFLIAMIVSAGKAMKSFSPKVKPKVPIGGEGTKPPIIEDLKPPVVDDVQAPVVDEVKAPVVDDVKPPVVDDVKAPVVDESKFPVDDEVKLPVEETKVPVEEETKVPVEEETKVPVEEETKVPVEEESKVPVEEESKVPVEEESKVPVEEEKESGIKGGGSEQHPDINAEAEFGEFNYSQKTVSNKTNDGVPLDDVTASMKENGYNRKLPPPQMVRLRTGKLVTLDHRRLVAAFNAGIKKLPIHLIEGETPIDPDWARIKKFVVGKISKARMKAVEDFLGLPENTITEDYVAKTWEEAAVIRCAKQGNSFPLEGTPELPRISGGGGE